MFPLHLGDRALEYSVVSVASHFAYVGASNGLKFTCIFNTISLIYFMSKNYCKQ